MPCNWSGTVNTAHDASLILSLIWCVFMRFLVLFVATVLPFRRPSCL